MNIKAVIKEHGLTIKEVAERMGITRVALMQSLQRGTFTSRTLQRIADAIGCEVAEFYKDKTTLHAYIKIDDQLYEASSVEELKELIKDL